MAVSGAVYDTKISDACTIKKHWLGYLFSRTRHPMHTKISDACTIKKHCPGGLPSCFV